MEKHMQGPSDRSLKLSISAASTFDVETLDKGNFQAWLEQKEIMDIARFEYGWCGRDEVLEVLETPNKLPDRLEHIRISNERKPVVFVINLATREHHWVTLVVHYPGHLVYYVDPLKEPLPAYIDHKLKNSLNNIVIEEVRVEEKSDLCDCGILALENARVILEEIGNSRKLSAEVLKYTGAGLKKKRGELAVALRYRNIIKRKLEVLLEMLEKFNEKGVNIKTFDYQSAIIFLLFLETVALQDLILMNLESKDEKSNKFKYKQKIIDLGIIDHDDMELIKYIRSKLIMHRNVNCVFVPSDFENVVNISPQVGFEVFFRDLREYVLQTVIKLEKGIPDHYNFKKPRKLLKTEIQNQKNIQFGNIVSKEEYKNKVLDFFRDATKEGYTSCTPNLIRADEMFFEFIVNVIPFIDQAYQSLLKPFEDIKRHRGDLIHKFYENGDDPKFLGLKLKMFIKDNKHHFFKYYYSQRVHGLLLEAQTNNFNSYEIKKRLETSLEDFENEFGKQSVIDKEDKNSFEFIFDESIYLEISDKNNIKRSVHEYLKLMSVIDCEEASEHRKNNNKLRVKQERYELKARDRREIYEEFKSLKDFIDNLEETEPDNEESLYKGKKYTLSVLKEKFGGPFGISEDNFNAMIRSFMTNDNIFWEEGNWRAEQIILDALLPLMQIKINHSSEDILGMFMKRKDLKGNMGSLEQKISSIPEGETVKISVCSENNKIKKVSINTDQFVQNIFQIFTNTYVRYILSFNNIEEAFNDGAFLDYLVHEESIINRDFLKELLKIDYILPYIAKLVVNNKLMNDVIRSNDFELLTNKLLDKVLYLTHVETLLGADLKKLKIENKKIIYKKISERLVDNKIVIENINFMFKNHLNIAGILHSLTNIDTSSFIIREACKKIIKLLNRVVSEFYMSKQYDEALKILEKKIVIENKKHAIALIPTLVKRQLINDNDLEILQLQRQKARIKIKQQNFTDLLNIFVMIRNKIPDSSASPMENIENENFHFSLLILRDIAYAKHLLNKYKESYEEYKDLYIAIMRYALHENITADDPLTVECYENIIKSEKYKSIFETFPCKTGLDINKYLNILKVRADMAFELKCLAIENEYSSPNLALEYYKEALSIYCEVNNIDNSIFHKDSVRRKGMVGTMRNMAFINNKISKLIIECCKGNKNELDKVLFHRKEASKKYSEVYDIELEIFWKTHPCVVNTERNLQNTNLKKAQVYIALGDLEFSKKCHKGIDYYKHAQIIFKQVYKFCEDNLGKYCESTWRAQSGIAFTYNKTARLSENKLPYYNKALKIYSDILEGQKKELGEESNLTLKTYDNIQKTEQWIKRIQQSNNQRLVRWLPVKRSYQKRKF